ncbi:DUF2799 domain-containing protein [Lentisalinibacter sediminis]|uniref:DUF2799 domain-containing protein n=1 Tax=Lentisalinibacter sediminis TaxID=2992237 RepID=UPI003866CF49
MGLKRLITAAAALALAGCASMSAEECLIADWEAIGYEDGARGASADTIGRHRKACASAGITPDFHDYERGRQAGLVEYCRPGVGYRVGASGGGYGGACPADLEPDFMAGYVEGRELYELRSEVSRIENRIDARANELERVRADMAANSARLIAGEATAEERVRLLMETKEISRREGELESEIAALHRDAAVARSRLEDYEARAASAY